MPAILEYTLELEHTHFSCLQAVCNNPHRVHHSFSNFAHLGFRTSLKSHMQSQLGLCLDHFLEELVFSENYNNLL